MKNISIGDEVKVIEFRHHDFGDLDGYYGTVVVCLSTTCAVKFAAEDHGTLIIPNSHLSVLKHSPKPTKKSHKKIETTLTVHDLLPEYDSYIVDVEGCLQGDADTWEKYLKNPVPFIVDLLMDFATFPADVENPRELAVAVAEKHCGR